MLITRITHHMGIFFDKSDSSDGQIKMLFAFHREEFVSLDSASWRNKHPHTDEDPLSGSPTWWACSCVSRSWNKKHIWENKMKGDKRSGEEMQVFVLAHHLPSVLKEVLKKAEALYLRHVFGSQSVLAGRGWCDRRRRMMKWQTPVGWCEPDSQASVNMWNDDS